MSGQAKGMSYSEAVVLGFLVVKESQLKGEDTKAEKAYLFTPSQDVMNATGLSIEDLDTALKALCERGFIELKIRDSPPKLLIKLVSASDS